MRYQCGGRGLSVAIIARDEERHIGAALASVYGLASEIVVLLDDRTADHTARIADTYGARVYVEPWRGFPGQRNRALALCNSAWILLLDADEQISPELRSGIKRITDFRLQTENSQFTDCYQAVAGYWIPRQNMFFGRVIHSGGWYPDYQLRLLRRGKAHYDETRLVHEIAQLDGEASYLQGHLLHINVDGFNELWREQYAILDAQMLYLAGRRARWRDFISAPLHEFYRRYLHLGGYRDGALGLLLCGTVAYSEFVKYVHLKRLEYSANR